MGRSDRVAPWACALAIVGLGGEAFAGDTTGAGSTSASDSGSTSDTDSGSEADTNGDEFCGDDCSGVICINGAAAHLASPGDLVIIATFAEVEASAAAGWQPQVVFVDGANRMVAKDQAEIAGPKRRLSALA